MHAPMKYAKGSAIVLLMLGLAFAALAGSASARIDKSTPLYDNTAYTPGEEITLTFTGLNRALQYDLKIELANGTAVMENLNVSIDTGNQYPWTFVIPADWDGTYWARAYHNNTTTSVDSRTFEVKVFRLFAEADHNIYLPGDTVTVYYYTQKLVDQKPLDSGNGRWKATITRDNGTGTITDSMGQPFTAPTGSFTFTLPVGTITGTYRVEVNYNDSADKHTASEIVFITVGQMNVYVTLDRGTHAPGDNVIATVHANAIGGPSEPTPGVSVTAKIYKYDTGNGTWNEQTRYSIGALTTDSTGTVSFVFVLGDYPDDTQIRVTVTATKNGAPVEASAFLTVLKSTTFSIDFDLKQTSYRPGDTITGTVTIVASNESLRTGAMYLWTFTRVSTDQILLREYSSLSAKSYTIPSDFTGQLRVEVEIFTPDDRSYARSQLVDVFAWALLINPSRNYYLENDTIRVDVTLVSDSITTPLFLYTVTPVSGGSPLNTTPVSPQTPGGRSFNFSFVAGSDDRYMISVTASGSGKVVSDSTTVSLEKFVNLVITVPDRSFKPGETIPIHYKFVPVGGATLPPTATLRILLSGGFGLIMNSDFTVEVSAMEGDIRYPIPSHAPSNADLQLTVQSFSASGSLGSSGTSVFMRPAAGAAPASAAASTATWGVAIGVIALLLAAFALMRKPRMPAAAEAAPKSPSTFGELKTEAPHVEKHEEPKATPAPPPPAPPEPASPPEPGAPPKSL